MDTNARGFWLVKRTLGWKNFMPENFLEINRYFALTSYCNTIGQSNNAFSILGFSLAGNRTETEESMFWSFHPLADKTNNEHLPKPFFKVIQKSLYSNGKTFSKPKWSCRYGGLAPSGNYQDSPEFGIKRRGFRIPGARFQSLSVKLGFWIRWSVFRITKPSKMFPDSGFHKQKVGFPYMGQDNNSLCTDPPSPQ